MIAFKLEVGQIWTLNLPVTGTTGSPIAKDWEVLEVHGKLDTVKLSAVGWVGAFFSVYYDDFERQALCGNWRLKEGNKSKETERCYHNKAKYVGFTDIFDYCTKCNIKL